MRTFDVYWSFGEGDGFDLTSDSQRIDAETPEAAVEVVASVRNDRTIMAALVVNVARTQAYLVRRVEAPRYQVVSA